MLPARQQELPPGIPIPRAHSLDAGLVPNARTWEALQCAWKGPVSPKWILQMTEACPKHPHLTKQKIYGELSKSALFMMSGPSEEEGSPRWGAQLCELTCVTTPAIRAHVGHHVTSAIFPPPLLPEPSHAVARCSWDGPHLWAHSPLCQEHLCFLYHTSFTASRLSAHLPHSSFRKSPSSSEGHLHLGLSRS